MNIQEFKAWFAGFRENLKGTPNEKQWARICERIEEIEDKPAPREVIIKEVERYIPQPRRWLDLYGPRFDSGPDDLQVWAAIGEGEFSSN